MRWTLEYVESMDIVQFQETVVLIDAVDKARHHKQERANRMRRR